jgi:hypothetical protein
MHGARPCHTSADAALAGRYAFQQTAKYKKGDIVGKQQNTIRNRRRILELDRNWSWTAIFGRNPDWFNEDDEEFRTSAIQIRR